MKENNTSPKAKQFSEELNELLAKYQYSLVPKVQYTENGIIPWMAIVEVIPPKTVTPAQNINKEPKEEVNKITKQKNGRSKSV